MKNTNFKILFFIVILASLLGCEDFLEIEPKAVISADGYLQSEKEAEQILTGAYDMLCKRYTTELGEWTAAQCDDHMFEQFPWFDYAAIQTSDATIHNVWIDFFEAVRRTNQVIKKVGAMPDSKIDPDVRDRYVAEAKYLRAFYHFLMHRLWGTFPIVTEVLPAIKEDLQVEKATLEEIWSQIQQDLDDARAVLPEQSAYASKDLGRATLGAANALKAIVHLYQGEWQDAHDRANDVISSGEYRLTDNWMDAIQLDHNSEVIWARLAMDGGLFLKNPAPGESWPETSEGTEAPIWARTGKYGGWMQRPGSGSLHNEFEDGDPRLNWTLAIPGDTINGQVVPDSARSTGFGYQAIDTRLYGARKLWYETGWPPSSHKRNAGWDWPFIRLAEIYLVRAEANIKLGNLDDAANDINMVRSRTSVQMPDVGPFSNEEEAMDAIIHERRVELAFERKRKFDLVRWGIAEKVLSKLQLNYESPRNDYWPIPQKEIDLSDGKLKQNPGY